MNVYSLFGALVGLQSVQVAVSCGGSLVAPEFVLTAAHCPYEPGDWAYVGALSDPFLNGNNGGQTAYWSEIKKTYSHPDYSFPSHDYQLLQLKNKVTTISPVTMDQSFSNSYANGKALWVAGLGRTIGNVASAPDDLQDFQHAYLPNGSCSVWSDNSMLCVQATGSGSCYGDSGGPLYDKQSKVLAGVVSGGPSMCTNAFPKYFARVAEEYCWIKDTICDNHSNPKPAFCTASDDCGGGSSGSCMSGNTGLIATDKEGTFEEVQKLKQTRKKTSIMGYNKKLKRQSCRVLSVGKWGTGPLYGNYTSDHYIFSKVGGENMVAQHGQVGERTNEKKYEILTTCPLNEDEAGNMFTPIDSDFCGSNIDSMSWSDYLLLHKAIMRIVLKTKVNYFTATAYTSFDTVKNLAPAVCSTMLKCMQSGSPRGCVDFENVAKEFMYQTLKEAPKAKTMRKMKNIGNGFEKNSATYVILGLK